MNINPLDSKWVVDPCIDAYGHWTIRIADDTECGNTDEEPIATVYKVSAANHIVAVNNIADRLAAALFDLRSSATYRDQEAEDYDKSEVFIDALDKNWMIEIHDLLAEYERTTKKVLTRA